MTMKFRNLDFDATTPVDEWPAEAIETVIDRGSLSDWHRLAEAIGRVAASAIAPPMSLAQQA